MKKKILLSANDFGAGAALFPVYEELLSKNELEIFCLISGPSQNLFKEEMKGVHYFSTPAVEKYDPLLLSHLINEACKYVNLIKPDILLTGISSSYAGIDEALLKLCKNKIKTFSFQDYWGHINLNLEICADQIFVLDQLAFDLTLKIVNVPISIVGSPKYDYYIKHTVQNFINHKESHKKLISEDYDLFIGQPLWHIESYKKTIHDVIKEYKKRKTKLIYLPHPLEDKGRIKSEFEKDSINILEERPSCIESVLMNASKILSCFSTCIFDAILLKEILKINYPQIASLFMYEEIQEAHKNYSGGLEFFPLENKGVSVIRTLSELDKFVSGQIADHNFQIESQKINPSKKILEELTRS